MNPEKAFLNYEKGFIFQGSLGLGNRQLLLALGFGYLG
jgi:hypothetical protein